MKTRSEHRLPLDGAGSQLWLKWVRQTLRPCVLLRGRLLMARGRIVVAAPRTSAIASALADGAILSVVHKLPLRWPPPC